MNPTEEEDCTTWVRPPPAVKSVNEEEKASLLKGDEATHHHVDSSTSHEKADDGAVVDKKGLVLSLILLVLSIPALIGAWCWPALVIGLLSGTITAAARALGHYISFGVTLTLMIGVNIYIFWCAQTKRKKSKYQYGPLLVTILAGVLIMADLTRHILQDSNVWKPGPFPGSSEYRPGCEKENVTCLSLIGVLFTIICTYTGFILLFIGTMWNANLLEKMKKIKKQFLTLRAGKAQQY